MPASLNLFSLGIEPLLLPLARLAHTAPPLKNRGDADARTFEITVEFFPTKAKLVDGSIQVIERDTIVKWEVDFAEIDPQDIQSMGEQAVKIFV
jgi:hypothetical protein